MAPDEDRIGSESTARRRSNGQGSFHEVADVKFNAWSTVTTGILTDNRLTFGTYLEGLDAKVREDETRLDAHTARAGSNVPENKAMGQVEGL